MQPDASAPISGFARIGALSPVGGPRGRANPTGALEPFENCMELPPIWTCRSARCLKIQAGYGYRAPWLWKAPEPCSRRMGQALQERVHTVFPGNANPSSAWPGFSDTIV